jgi:AcrR family transcriptional regulator
VSVPEHVSKNRWQQRQEQTRLDFLNAALLLVLEKGYDALTVSAIVRRANYGRSTFYAYFNDKEGVVWALFEHYMGALDEHIIASVQHLESPLREYRSWQIIFTNIEAQREFFLQMEVQATLTLRQIMKDYLIRQFEGHLRAGRFSLLTDVPPEIAARFFVVTIVELLEYWLRHPETGSAAEMVDRLFVLIFRQPAPRDG